MNKTIERAQPQFLWSTHILTVVFIFLLFAKLSTLDLICGRPKTAQEYLLLGHMLCFVASMAFLLKYFVYKNTFFDLGDNSIRYEQAFIIFSQRNIKYKYIKEITLYRGIVQRIFGLGTIHITTHAITQFTGMQIHNIKNYQEVHDLLMEKISK
jgi:uncharacterized membrane protein YdbT with pleckstrin-like domain